MTDVAPVNSVPVMMTVVPPASGPFAGEMPVTVGEPGALYVNSSAGESALVPAGVSTVTSTVPAVPAGETAVIWESESTEKLAAPSEPNMTDVAPVNSVPVMMTVVPPASGPFAGEMPVTVTAALATPIPNTRVSRTIPVITYGNLVIDCYHLSGDFPVIFSLSRKEIRGLKVFLKTGLSPMLQTMSKLFRIVQIRERGMKCQIKNPGGNGMRITVITHLFQCRA
jgi:hypothetical protein